MSRRRWGALAALALVTLGLAAVAPAPVARGQSVPGELDTGGSAVTVPGAKRGNEDFSGLAVTVSQTRDLVNQAITVSWTGGRPTPRNRLIGVDYLQIMQCWGDPNDPADPTGLKLRETCQFGLDLAPPAFPVGVGRASTDAGGRRIRVQNLDYPDVEDADRGVLPVGDHPQQIVPFRSVRGEISRDGSPQRPYRTITDPRLGTSREEFPSEVLSEFFSPALTNEYPYALTAGDGTGRVSFEVQNAGLAPHLGCGGEYRDPAGVTRPSRPCWLVIVPRGHFDPYANPAVDVSTTGAVDGSPFRPALWQHRMVVPLQFAPVAGYCSLTAAERRTAGSEMIAEAITAWQPALCANNGPIFGYSAIGDFEADRQVTLPTSGAPGLVFTANPVSPGPGVPEVVHAPAALSSVVIGTNVDANFVDPNLGSVPPDVQALAGTALRDIKLTPRLLAKLLTQSYQRDAKAGSPGSDPRYPNPTYPRNPNSIRFDQEFLDLNPLFAYWDRSKPANTLDGLLVSVGSSAAAREVWRWILSDGEARAWLGGVADARGMAINPYYRGLADAPPDNFPKVDPACTQAEGPFISVTLPHCTLDLRPYMGSLNEAAVQTLRADNRGTDNLVVETDAGPRLSRTPRRSPGSRFGMSITDSASAARYDLAPASLCRPVKDSAGRYLPVDCRAPTAEAVSAAVATAVNTSVPGVKVVDPVKAWATPGAYPLAMLTYAVADTSEPADARREYATLLRHIAGEGQQPGLARGQLPHGYVPLPQSMRALTMIAADRLEHYTAPTTAPPPPPNDSAGPTPSLPPTTAAPAPTGVPAGGLTPSAAGTAPSPAPSAQPAAQATRGNPLGTVRYLLVGALVCGLLGGIAGPILRRLGLGSGPPPGDPS